MVTILPLSRTPRPKETVAKNDDRRRVRFFAESAADSSIDPQEREKTADS
jgi:hypothetical protein